jgi:2-C-methyl-D-erythritol 4-phosphate cytidylyltransferase
LTVALIVAAGRGERLGAGQPKALAQLAGRTLLQRSLDVLRSVAAIERVIVALPPGVAAPEGTVGVLGGAVRSESVRLALAAAGSDAGQGLVLVHDAARPLLTAELVEAVIAAAQRDGVDGAIAAAPVIDTIKRAGDHAGRVGEGQGHGDGGEGRIGGADHVGGDEHVVSETLDRSSLWAVQTPQVFRRAVLERALDVSKDVLAQATDDAWLVERAGGRVIVVEAPRENLKVTTSLDLALAEMLLASRPA